MLIKAENLKGKTTNLFESSPKVRLEIKSGNSIISKTISASYGFEEATGEVQLRFIEGGDKKIEPNTVTLMLTEEPKKESASIHLIDALSGIELTCLKNVKINISF